MLSPRVNPSKCDIPYLDIVHSLLSVLATDEKEFRYLVRTQTG